MWSYILSMTVVNTTIKDVKVLADNNLTYINKYMTFKVKSVTGEGENEYIKVQLIITLQSLEMADLRSRADVCNGHGHHVTLPYSTQSLCQCHGFFDGEYCHQFSNIEFASTINDMILATTSVQKLREIYSNKSEDTCVELKLGFGSIDKTVESLRRVLSTSYGNFDREMSIPFAWNKLESKYSQAVFQIDHWSNIFRNISLSERKQKALAKTVLHKSGKNSIISHTAHMFNCRLGEMVNLTCHFRNCSCTVYSACCPYHLFFLFVVILISVTRCTGWAKKIQATLKCDHL